MNSYDEPCVTTERNNHHAAHLVICGPCEVSWTSAEGQTCWNCGYKGISLWGRGKYECPNKWDYELARKARFS